MKHVLSRGALSSIVVTSIAGLGFVACTIDESGTNTSSSTSTTGTSTTSSGMGGEPAGSTSSSSGTAGMGGAGGGSSSSGSSSGGPGSPCMQSSDCSGGRVCEDGVCCAGTCGPCQSCNQAGSMGTCKAVSEGTDDCMENGQRCSAMGTCACNISVPPTVTMCPMGWDGPFAGQCKLTADTPDEYKSSSADINCPPDADCLIDCTGTGACESTTFNCPPGHKCTMRCTNMDSCKNAVLNCSNDGPCNVECTSGGMSCKVTVNCGQNSCSATCGDTSKPIFVPNMDTACPAAPCPP